MAIDTIRKRASCIGFAMPFRLTLPIADGSLDVGDRGHLLGCYGAEFTVVVSSEHHDCGNVGLFAKYNARVSAVAKYNAAVALRPHHMGTVQGKEC